MFPLRDDNPTLTTPWITRALIVLNLGVFVYELMLGSHLPDFFTAYALVPRRLELALQGAIPLAPAALTLVTSMFLHGGWTHLIGNLWYLWIFGDNVEDHLGHVGYLAFFLAAGVAAGALHSAINAGSALPTVGASGAIAGVLGVYAATFPRARVVTLLPLFPIFPVVGLPAMLVLGFWFVMQFANGTLALAGAPDSGVAWWAHIGGFALGFAVGKLTKPRLFSPERMI